MVTAPMCPWCLSTPARHDRCYGVMYASVQGDGFAVFDPKTWRTVECACECRQQQGLF
jgi:hypothetical protein